MGKHKKLLKEFQFPKIDSLEESIIRILPSPGIHKHYGHWPQFSMGASGQSCSVCGKPISDNCDHLRPETPEEEEQRRIANKNW